MPGVAQGPGSDGLADMGMKYAAKASPSKEHS
jgi:hypothetical protein